jgi:hypothetical protein
MRFLPRTPAALLAAAAALMVAGAAGTVTVTYTKNFKILTIKLK